MLKIYKYELRPYAHKFEMEMPFDSAILKVAMQKSQPVMWALVDPEAPPQTRRFEWIETGADIPYPGYNSIDYRGTIEDSSGYVLHLFEV